MKPRRILIIISGLLTLLFITGCVAAGSTGWAGSSQGNGTIYISYGQLFAVESASGKQIWRFPSSANNSVAIYTPAAITEDLVVVGASNHALFGIDSRNGMQKWSFEGAKEQYIGGILHVAGIYYAPNNDWNLYAVNNMGKLIWKFSTKAANWSKPVSNGDMVFLASMDHNLYAFKTEYNQSELSADKDGQKIVVKKPVWEAPLGGAAVMEPVLEDNVLYVGTLAGTIKSIDSKSGSEIWSFGNSGSIASIWSKPAIQNGILFFADEKGSIYALDAKTGKNVWDTPYVFGDAVIAGAVTTSEGVVFSSKTGRSILINASKQVKELVSMQGAIYTTPLYTAESLILVPANNQYLAAAIKIDGTLLWNFAPVKD